MEVSDCFAVDLAVRSEDGELERPLACVLMCESIRLEEMFVDLPADHRGQGEKRAAGSHWLRGGDWIR